jgi:hypothetical protein
MLSSMSCSAITSASGSIVPTCRGNAFVTAGQAWKLARAGAAAPDMFGHGEARGVWFLRVNVYRDLLALANLHTSLWDTWRGATAPSKLLAPSDAAAVDDLAGAIAAAETAGDRIAALTELASASQVPPWLSRPTATAT